MGEGMQKTSFLLQGRPCGRKVIGCVCGAAGRRWGVSQALSGDDPDAWSSHPLTLLWCGACSRQACLPSLAQEEGGEMLTFSSTFAQVECNSMFL